MMPRCQAPIPDETLLDYWAHDPADGDETDRVEAHLFACGDCSARLHHLAVLGTGLATLVRQGRVSGIVSRALLNRMQRDGVRLRMFSLLPGETVPCGVSRR
jgi:Putative zinc-finger